MRQTVLALALERLNTPLGEMLILTDEAGTLRAVDWRDHQDRLDRLLTRHYGAGGCRLSESDGPQTPVRAALDAYFQGDIHAIDALPTVTAGTAFQRSVWAALRAIPAGRTLTYGALANIIGRPAAVRAVGLANGANPIGVVVPCHRIIGADGTLTGYGGGLHRKKWLLNHEGAADAVPELF